MPYIKEDERKYLDQVIQGIVDEKLIQSEGQFNYFVTNLLLKLWHGSISYYGIANIVGVLETLKLEFYRRVAVPYEDLKIEENGDAY